MGVKYSEGLSTLAPKTWLIFSIMAGLYIYIHIYIYIFFCVWVVVKIRVPFGVLSIIRHLIFRVLKKGK